VTDPARGDGLPAPAPEALAAGFAALAAFAAGPYDDRGVTDAASLAADTFAYLDTAARRGGLTAVTTVGVITACAARASRVLQPALPRAGDWLGEQISEGRVTGGRPPAELARLARRGGALTAGCAGGLAGALGDAHDLVRGMIGPEPDFAGAVPYDDLDTVRAATLGAGTAEYLAAAVAGGGVTGPATLTALYAGLAAAFRGAAPLLAWSGDWLGNEITAGRVIGGRPLPELAAAARESLETSATLAAHLARALQSARNVSAALGPAS
jgi:hypothetical protein